jgi:hypothetical protein
MTKKKKTNDYEFHMSLADIVSKANPHLFIEEEEQFRKERYIEKHIYTLANSLLDALKRPSTKKEGFTFELDHGRMRREKIDNSEPVNWASLRCCGVNLLDYKGTEFNSIMAIVEVEEAMPDECPTLCAYIERYMLAWGWRVEVKTEW